MVSVKDLRQRIKSVGNIKQITRAMEMVAWLAGEKHSDEPQCTCPVLASYVRALNDLLPSDAARDRLLRRMVPRLVNTTASIAEQRRRGFRLADAAAQHALSKATEASAS